MWKQKVEKRRTREIIKVMKSEMEMNMKEEKWTYPDLRNPTHTNSRPLQFRSCVIVFFFFLSPSLCFSFSLLLFLSLQVQHSNTVQKNIIIFTWPKPYFGP